jgi:F-type H+-transporting ATPase subunit gamma
MRRGKLRDEAIFHALAGTLKIAASVPLCGTLLAMTISKDMATLKSIRKRITSVKNTQKITKAMKMVAAAKLRRAQQALVGAPPHAEILQGSLSRLVADAEAWDHPLIRSPEQKNKAHVLVFTSDRGLCGGFNGNLLRQVEQWLQHEGRVFPEVGLSNIGRKGRDFYKAKKRTLASVSTWAEHQASFVQATQWAQQWQEGYESGQFDVLYLAYNSFKSAISQVPVISQVFPIAVTPLGETHPAPVAWEGDPKTMIDQLIARQVATQFFRAILESQASELGARMSAMDNASNNADEMIKSLTLKYNRARQAAITLELMDIVNGKEALG